MQIKCFLRYNDIIQTSLMYTMLRIQYEYTQKQCVGVAIEGMDIWYMGLTTRTLPSYTTIALIFSAYISPVVAILTL